MNRQMTGAHIRFGDPEQRLPVDTPEQIAAAKCALSDAGVHFVSVRQANGYHNGATIWADEATWPLPPLPGREELHPAKPSR